jgi:hypothetical protein
MTTVTTQTTLGQAPIPQGVTPGPDLVRLKNPAGQTVQFKRTASPAPVFEGVAPGSYVLTAQREGTNEEPIGDEVSAAIEVPDLTPRTDVPVAVSATFAP